MSHTKEYVQVVLTVNEEGKISPNSIIFQKEKKYDIECLKGVCEAAATNVLGHGVRYTVVIKGKETFLFQEAGRWFVEAKATA